VIVTRFGFWETLYERTFEALERTIDLNLFLVNRHRHTAHHNAPADDIPTFEFRVLTPDEVRRFAQDPGIQMTPAFAESALARGDYCFGVLKEDRLVAYDWRGLQRPVPLNDDLDVHYARPGQVYGYAMYTRPEFRGLHLQLHNLRHANRRLLAEGQTHTVGYVALQNLASIRNLSRIHGQVFVGMAGYIRLWGRYLTFRTPGARRIGFRLQSCK